MSKFLAMFLKLLPVFIVSAEQVGTDLTGHQKKSAVQDSLAAVAAGVGAVSPSHAQAAQDAATVASTSIDGVVSLLNELGVLKHSGAASAPPVAALTPATVTPIVAADSVATARDNTQGR